MGLCVTRHKPQGYSDRGQSAVWCFACFTSGGPGQLQSAARRSQRCGRCAASLACACGCAACSAGAWEWVVGCWESSRRVLDSRALYLQEEERHTHTHYTLHTHWQSLASGTVQVARGACTCINQHLTTHNWNRFFGGTTDTSDLGVPQSTSTDIHGSLDSHPMAMERAPSFIMINFKL